MRSSPLLQPIQKGRGDPYVSGVVRTGSKLELNNSNHSVNMLSCGKSSSLLLQREERVRACFSEAVDQEHLERVIHPVNMFLCYIEHLSKQKYYIYRQKRQPSNCSTTYVEINARYVLHRPSSSRDWIHCEIPSSIVCSLLWTLCSQRRILPTSSVEKENMSTLSS